ncbi:cytochrome P450 [Aspergillus parasiticus]|uniref:Cytochrome P450 n=1 Tax=Aspergillus parasiticus TaxID=5067 RepID=A0A5N6DLP6_ASPPA|nr:cytochrome P450 [Aspergillus parasiticus]
MASAVPIIYMLGMAIYNVYFHPLNRFPGPVSHAISRIPYFYRSVRGTLPFDMLKLHERYGDIVRIAPDELAFSHPDAWKDIFSHKNGEPEMAKATWFYRPLDDPLHIVNEDTDEHRRLVISDWYNFTTFDIIGDLAFGEPFGCLEGCNYDQWIKGIFEGAYLGSFMQALSFVPWLKSTLLLLVPKSMQEAHQRHKELTTAKMLRRAAITEKRPDLIEGLLRNKDELKLGIDKLIANAEILIIGGSETTASLLSGVTYLLLQNPNAYETLKHEVRSKFNTQEEINLISVNKLSYMLACLDEALRMYPPIANGLPRVCPKDGSRILGEYIPGKPTPRLIERSTNINSGLISDRRLLLLPQMVKCSSTYHKPSQYCRTEASYPGSNNIDGGVLVALSGLDSYKVHSDTIDVGPGLAWYDVYKALAPYGRAAIGGRMKTIGVPGLTLIGGFHYFNNKYGYAMDNVVSYDVVLGNGTQVVASNVSHPDLFWALKGGANNYGIVTKFTLNTFDVPQVTTSIQVFNETYFPSFFEAMCHSASLDETDPIAAGMIATVTYNATTKVASASLLGVQEGVSNPPSQFANFTKIPATERINNVTTLSQWAENLDSPKQMFRVMFSHKTMKPDPDMLYSIYKAWKAAVDDISDVEGLYPTFVLNEITPSSLRVAQTNGVGNVWGLEPEPLMIWQFSTGWANAQDDLRVESWARQLTEHLHSINQEKGLASEFIYMGDAGEWQDPYAGFPPENVQRMRDIRTAYDPKGIFSTLSWGGFKLGL